MLARARNGKQQSGSEVNNTRARQNTANASETADDVQVGGLRCTGRDTPARTTGNSDVPVCTMHHVNMPCTCVYTIKCALLVANKHHRLHIPTARAVHYQGTLPTWRLFTQTINHHGGHHYYCPPHTTSLSCVNFGVSRRQTYVAYLAI